MRPDQVQAVLGRPLGDDAWDDGNLNDSLIYDGLRLQFSECGTDGPLSRSRLCCIEVRRPDAELFGRPLKDWDEPALAATLAVDGFRLKVAEPGYAEFESPYIALWFGPGGQLTKVEIAARQEQLLRADRAAYDAVLNRVPAAPPEPGDER
jgi:hypothetical protein